jgi:hypothetical protein
MSRNSALLDTASAVVAPERSRAEIGALNDASLIEGMHLVREHERELQSYKLWLAAEIAGRSSHEAGYSGLARRNGAATPAIFIQSLTGQSLGDASKLAALGSLMVDDDKSPLTAAAAAGAVSLAEADAIRRGLGVADDAVTETQLRVEAERLIAQASAVTPELLLRLARQSRAELDHAAVERGEKVRASLRYVRRFRRDGMSGGSWLLPDEDGGLEIDTALRLLLAAQTGGPRFAEVDENLLDAGAALRDARTNEQVLADGFAQFLHIGIAAEPSIVPGAQRASVRVVVEESVLEARRGSALLEATLTPVTFGKLEEYLCEGGTVAVVVDQQGDIVNFGREQRLFTARQRAALAVRDGGCRFPGCEKPPSWCEAHHVDFWARDRGKTDLENGILLCRYHHMLMHNALWEIQRCDGAFWVRPPAAIDSERTRVEMPSRSPIVAGIRQRRAAGAG